MIFRCFALSLAVTLSGCCASGVGCNAPASGGPVAWDGLDPTPPENTTGDSAGVKRKSDRRTIVEHTDTGSQVGDTFERQQAADRNADAKLNKQLKICSNC
jgi:hypothetical protein